MRTRLFLYCDDYRASTSTESSAQHRGRDICSPKIHGALMQLKAGENVMSKGQKSNKETKKVPAMTAKEKKAAKKAKKNQRGRIGE
jgi:hypothetical protein